MKETLRTFLAFPIHEGLVQKIALLQKELQSLQLDAKWVHPEKIHLTLKFMGETPREALQEIQKTVEAVGHQHAAFQVTINTLGAFPDAPSARIVWIGSASSSSEGEALAQALHHALQPLGFPIEAKPFKAHLTLGRIRSPKNREALVQFLKGFSFPWEETLLFQRLIHYQSTLTPQGPLYRPLYEVSLK